MLNSLDLSLSRPIGVKYSYGDLDGKILDWFVGRCQFIDGFYNNSRPAQRVELLEKVVDCVEGVVVVVILAQQIMNSVEVWLGICGFCCGSGMR